MYTRYSGIDVPQNYSGNRFRKKAVEDTETKVHTSVTQGAVKSSVSPSFEKQFKSQQLLEDDDISLENSKITEDAAENEDNYNEFSDTSYQAEENEVTDSMNIHTGILDNLNLSFIGEYLKSIKGEDLLLIALIIFLASDKNVSNNDIIILLALLLVYHT